MRTLTPYESTQLAKHGLSHLANQDLGDQPIEYLTGWVDFCGLNLHVSPAVLIPRPETEQLVDMALVESINRSQMNPNQTLAILDVCCGSGAIGLSLAHQLAKRQIPFAITLTDISEPALAVARQNLGQIDEVAQAHIKIYQIDLLSNQLIATQKWDLILSNPPYIPRNRLATLPSSVKDFEPQVALDGGPDGLSLIHDILKQSQPLLKSGSKIMLEVDDTHTAQSFAPFQDDYIFEFITDFQQKNRFVVGSIKEKS